MRIVIVPYGERAVMQAGALGDALAEFFDCRTDTETSRELPPEGYDRRRRQYGSAAFRDDLTAGAGLDAAAAAVRLGVTDADLFIPRLNFIFGEADRQRRVAIVSLNRLFPGEETAATEGLLAERLLKEAIHETGHVLGLDHCDDRSCVMCFSNTVADTDAKGPGLCDRCAAAIPTGGEARGSDGSYGE